MFGYRSFNVIVNFQELLGRKLVNSLEVALLGLTLKLLLLMSRRTDKKVETSGFILGGQGVSIKKFVDAVSYSILIYYIYYKIPNSTLNFENTNSLK